MAKDSEKKFSIVKTVFNFVFWIAIIGLAIIWLVDFFLVRNDKDPIFCLSKEVHEVEDGTVEECTGLGYKVYSYDRTGLQAKEFGPFFIEMQE